jgi:hypothetical protein
MRFLIGLIVGTAIAMSVTSPPETRGRLIDTATAFFKQIHLPEDIPAATAAEPEQVNPVKADSQKGAVQPQTQHQDGTPSLVTQSSPAERSTSAVGASDMRFALLPLSLVQAAWSPFYSQASANGFAARLERHLEREFRVVKKGPANYEVVFDYSNETERKAVLESIRVMTGYEPQPPRGST